MSHQATLAADIVHSPDDLRCACAACSTFVPVDEGTSVGDASLDPSAGGTFANKPIWTLEQITAHLNRTGGGFADGFNDTTQVGRQNNIGDDNSVITFGFFDTQAQVGNNGYTYTAPNPQGVPTRYGLAEFFNFAAFTEAQRSATREAMQGWDDVIAITFKEVSADEADMNFGNLASAPTTQAYARIPTIGLDNTLGGQVREIGGDSWISASQPSNFQLDEGGYGLQTLAHEIGHSIGISHPGGYNAAPGLSITYAANAEYAQDTRSYSIMSYFNASSTGGRHFDFNISGTVFAGTPLIHDIAVAQRMYGADMTTRTGDTVYGFNSNAERDAFDFTKTPAPVVAIWDAGGNDTIDASGYNTDQVINLNAGSLSNIGGVTFADAPSFEQVNANRAAAGFAPVARAQYDANMNALKNNPVVGRLTDNVGIAYGAIIENAIGGKGNDVLIGNGVANVLDGGDGFDTASYVGASEGITFSAITRTGSGAAAGDTYISIEAFEGTNFADVMTGSALADTLGGAGGDDRITGGNGGDTLFGGAGNDLLDGGNDNDTLNGDAGADTLIGGNGNDTLNGGADADTLNGGNDIDTLNGGAGNDTLLGGNGNDVLNGGAGDDTLTGGTGNDIFLFTEIGGSDAITDFRRGQDKIDLSDLDANSLTDGTQGFSFVGANAFSGTGAASAGELRSFREGNTNFISGDTNGDGIADFTIATGSVLLTQTDIIFI